MMKAGKRCRWSAVVVIGLVAALGGGTVQQAWGQAYYYQPSPEYYHNDTASGTVLGGAMGAITGAIVGGKKHQGQGALIGAGIGAVTGNLLGRSQDEVDAQQAAADVARVQQMNRQAATLAVTNYDLVRMTQAGLNESLIISTMRSRGARLDLSPQSLISLKEQGVSDQVLLAAQDLRSGSQVVTPARPVYVREVPSVVVRPVARYYGYGHHPHSHAYPPGRIHYRVRF